MNLEGQNNFYGGELSLEEETNFKTGFDFSVAAETAASAKDAKSMEIEEKAGAKGDKQTGIAQEDVIGASEALAEKMEVDSRSIYVGNVDYACTPEEVQQHFQFCGTVNRVTILTDMYGQPKGYAYVEFVEVEAVQNALLLNETELHGRQLKVCAKRTNVPGMKQYRGRPRRPYMPGPPMYAPYGYGSFPRFRRSTRYMPY